MKVEFRQLKGKHRGDDGVVREIARNLDQVLADGRQVATISRLPGAPVTLMPSALLSPSQLNELSRAIKRERGAAPSKIIHSGPKLPGEILIEETE